MENNVLVKKIVLYNSAAYGYFEIDLDKHLILEGANNIGKTSVLNILQLLFLPENNLNLLNTKFAMSSGNDAKKYTGKDTYKYYFPEKNSYALIEVENKHTTFCVLIYGKNETKIEYVRHIFETSYKDIKHLLIKEKELQSESITDLINILKTKIISSREVKDKKDIKEVLYSPTGTLQNTKFNLVPLKDTKESTVGHFSLLFKSMYNIGNLNKENKKKLIADIIATQNLDKNKSYDFNLHELIVKYKDNQTQKTKLNVLRTEEDTYDFIKDNFMEQEIFKADIENQIAVLNDSIKKLLKEINKEYVELKKQEEEKSISLQEEKDIYSKLLEVAKEYSGDLKSNKNQIQEIIDKMDSLKRYVSDNMNIEEEINKDYLINNQKEILDIFKTKEDEIKTKIEEYNKQIEELERKEKENSSTKNQIETLEKEIKIINKEIESLKIKINNKPLYENDIFSVSQQKVLKCIFNDNFLKNNINNFEKDSLESMKKFIDIFTVEEDNIKLDKVQLKVLKKETFQLEEELEYNEEELANKTKIIKNLKELENSSYKEILLKQEVQKQDLEVKLKVIENHIHFVKNLNEEEIKYKRLTNKKIELEKEISKTEEAKKDSKKEIEKNNLELEEVKSKKNKLYGEEEREKDILDNIKSSEIELFIEKDVEECNIINDKVYSEYTDNKAKFQIIKTNINLYKKTQEELQSSMNKFIIKKVFEEMSEDTIINFNERKNYKKLFEYLQSLYNTLDEKEEYINNEIESQAQETLGAINVLKEAKSDIKALEKMINEEFDKLSISDLKGVRFKININKELDDKIKELDNNIDVNKSYLKEIIEVNNYLQNHSDETGIIKLETLIKSIQYETLIEGEYVETTQSNGTETMITLVFITLLFKEIFKSGYSFKIPIPVDEIGKVDIKNVNTLLDVMTDRRFTLVGALPNMIPEFRELFPKTISIGKVELEKPFSNKRHLLVEEDEDVFNMFEVQDIQEDSTELKVEEEHNIEI